MCIRDRCTSNKTLAFKGDLCSGGEHSNVHITVFKALTRYSKTTVIGKAVVHSISKVLKQSQCNVKPIEWHGWERTLEQ